MNTKTPAPAVELNPLEQAYRNYQTMEQLLDRTTERNRTLEISNKAFEAEVDMLQGQLRASDADRIRLQHVASSLMGQLKAINAVIADAAAAAVKAGVVALEAHEEALEKAAQRPAEPPAPELPQERQATQLFAQGLQHPGVPAVDARMPVMPGPVFRDAPRQVPRRAG